MTHPQILPRTAAALCEDRYIGADAMGDPRWGDANENSRSAAWGDWTFCYCPETRSVTALHNAGHVYKSPYMGGWEAA